MLFQLFMVGITLFQQAVIAWPLEFLSGKEVVTQLLKGDNPPVEYSLLVSTTKECNTERSECLAASDGNGQDS